MPFVNPEWLTSKAFLPLCRNRMTKKSRNWLIAIFILAFPFIAFFAFLISEMSGPLPPIQSLPHPNGYNDLVKAGQMIRGDVWDYDKANREKLRGIVSTNAEALDRKSVV